MGSRDQAVVADRPLAAGETVWDRQWDLVPDEWRSGPYRVGVEPWSAVFVQNSAYKAGHGFDLAVPGHPRASEEIAWWLHACWVDGLRKVEPSVARWYARSLAAVLDRNTAITGRPVESVADVEPDQVVRELSRLFQHDKGRSPSSDLRRHVGDVAESIQLLVSVRCRDHPWWHSDIWDLTVDGRIPRRAHEPAGDLPLRLVGVEPGWLREGLRFWLSFSLTYDLYTWTSCLSRVRLAAAHLSRFLTAHGIASPLLVEEIGELRPLMMEYVSWLRSPAAAPPKTGKPLSVTTIAQTQSTTQTFYTFMLDHAAEAVDFTGDPRWARLTADYARLWPPEHRLPDRRRGNTSPMWMSQADLHQMITCLPILTTPTSQEVTITLPGGRAITSRGLDDPQAMRAWLLQAMTGRRASEILLLDFDPILTLNPPPGNTVDDRTNKAGDTFVARLRYQQTKIGGVDPTILVEQAVVDLITDQQAWVADQVGHQPAYLFVGLRQNHQGLRPRSYQSHSEAMRRLDLIVNLTDATGKPLRFTKTHRLRHTRATELLNNGVPIHVVQRYLGHFSPEMTMRYAATLAETAEAEFLRYIKIGSDGRELELDPRDLYEKAQLDRRTDRILPNGYCLLPPAQACDRGNACLSCPHYATDRTHLAVLTEQRDQTIQLIEQRQAAFTARHGTPMGPDHVWLSQRHKEIAALDAIVARLTDETANLAIRGAGAAGRRVLPLIPVTDGAHHTTLRRG